METEVMYKRSLEEMNALSVCSLPNEDLSIYEGAILLSDTALQDLPKEILDYILLKAVINEVRRLRLAKCTWNRAAIRIVKELQTVCSQWDYNLTTNWFTIVLQRNLDIGLLVPAPICVRIVEKHELDHELDIAIDVTTMNSEVFVLCKSRSRKFINVYKRSNLTEVVSCIDLPKEVCFPMHLAACKGSDCIYVVSYRPRLATRAIFQLKKKDNFKEPVLSLESQCWRFYELLLSNDGNFMLPEVQNAQFAISLYNSDGIVQDCVPVPKDSKRFQHPTQKSNGNFVYSWATKHEIDHLSEIDKHGMMIHQYVNCDTSFELRHYAVDKFDRILIGGERKVFSILDSEFNPLEFICPDDLWSGPRKLHYDAQMNEVYFVDKKCLTVLSLIDGLAAT